ncbi:MAG: PAAR domain-containing protein [Paracoccaceae bacterium]|nr:PAAR domain-containing protein [Paracoccaceae bacterium]
MPGPPQARLTDMHTCLLTYGAPAPILPPCCVTVLVVKLPAARLGDMCPAVPHPIAKGSMTVMIGKMPAARIGIDLCGGPTPAPILPPGAITVLTGG